MFGDLFEVIAVFTVAMVLMLYLDFLTEGWILLRPPGRLAVALLYIVGISAFVMFFCGFLALMEVQFQWKTQLQGLRGQMSSSMSYGQ